ncbi:beta-glucosidase [Nocardioidaceae bacterium]|nr:beta-glucosidase [Nocardioidaceae bacterium]
MSPLAPSNRPAYGTATASYQVEGGLDTGGRGPSIWDTFAARPGAVVDGSDGSTACASWFRPEDDLDLVAGLGAALYRFSVAWPRIQPDGTGQALAAGLDYYDALVDGCLARGIAPMVTLYHWDLPQALEDAGGWLARDTAEAFAAYASLVAERLGDRVEAWATLNEPWCSAYLGYAAGVHAPGRTLHGRAHVAAHHLNLAHGLGAQALRAGLGERAEGRVGVVHNLAPVRPEDGSDATVAAGDAVDAIRNRVWTHPLVHGAYDEGLLRVAPELTDPAVVRDGDLALLHGSADWMGINYYTPVRVAAAEDQDSADAGSTDPSPFPGAPPLLLPEPAPVTDIGWEIDATGLRDVLLEAHELSGLPLVVSENGAACADPVGEDGVVHDEDRIDYLRDHVAAVDEAIEAGADVRAYLLWTLLDNFEWAEGYTKTFGIVHVDRSDEELRRTPKDSYRWYAEHIARRTSGS